LRQYDRQLFVKGAIMMMLYIPKLATILVHGQKYVAYLLFTKTVGYIL